MWYFAQRLFRCVGRRWQSPRPFASQKWLAQWRWQSPRPTCEDSVIKEAWGPVAVQVARLVKLHSDFCREGGRARGLSCRQSICTVTGPEASLTTLSSHVRLYVLCTYLVHANSQDSCGITRLMWNLVNLRTQDPQPHHLHMYVFMSCVCM